MTAPVFPQEMKTEEAGWVERWEVGIEAKIDFVAAEASPYYDFVDSWASWLVEKIYSPDGARRAMVDWWGLERAVDKWPCLFAVQAMLRGSKLTMVYFMRSSDEARWAKDKAFMELLAKKVTHYIEARRREYFVSSIMCVALVGSRHSYEQDVRGSRRG